MKRITVTRRGEKITITAPEGKSMAINDGMLAHSILSIAEYGPSGVKVAAFAEWDEVIFDGEDHGYTISEEHPF